MEKIIYKQYRRKSISEMRPYVEGEDLAIKGVSISSQDIMNGSPKVGDMIARNPKNHKDQWLVAKQYFEDNLEEISTPSESSDKGAEEIFLKHFHPNTAPDYKERILKAMTEYASLKEKEAHNNAVQECIDAINLDGRELHQIAQDKFNLTPSSPVTELEKLKR